MIRVPRIGTASAALTACLIALAGCSQAAPEDEATPSSSEPDSATSAEQTDGGSASPSEPEQSGGQGTGQGCEPTGDPGAVPQDIQDLTEVGDLDGDGTADQVAIGTTQGDELALSVVTASEAVLSHDFTQGSPIDPQAIGAPLGGGPAIVLVDSGRSVALLAVVDCDITEVPNEQGDPYTFDEGFTGYGTGVACEGEADDLTLFGYNAEATDDSYTVSRTPIDVAADGSLASNGQEETVGTDLPEDDPAVQLAQSVSCGDWSVQRDDEG